MTDATSDHGETWWDAHKLHLLAAAFALLGIVGFVSNSVRVGPLFALRALAINALILGSIWVTAWVWSERTDRRWLKWWAFVYPPVLLGAWIAGLASSAWRPRTWFFGVAVMMAATLAVTAYVQIFGGIGRWIGRPKGYPRAGWWLGLLLGPIGLVIVGVISPTSEAQAAQAVRNTEAVAAASAGDIRACPHCAEDIKAAALVCRFCGRDVIPAV